MMCASFHQVSLNYEERGMEKIHKMPQQGKQMEPTVRPRGLSQSLEATLKPNTRPHRTWPPSNARTRKRGAMGSFKTKQMRPSRDGPYGSHHRSSPRMDCKELPRCHV